LFEWDARSLPVGDCIFDYYDSLYSGDEEADVEPPPPSEDPFFESLAKGTVEHVAELDPLITQRAENWRLDRMPLVDRNILRMAIYEMKFVGTPPAVVIDEALELARRYSDEEAVPFINGVLDAVRKIIFPETLSQGA